MSKLIRNTLRHQARAVKARDAKFVAYLCRELRTAVTDHRIDATENPDHHRGCLWCYDGRAGHWYSDMSKFYGGMYGNEYADAILDRVEALYDRAYRGRVGCIF